MPVVENAEEAIEDTKKEDQRHEHQVEDSGLPLHQQRRLAFSPAFSTAERPDNYTLDWALYEVDPCKVTGFSSNVIDIGREQPVDKVASTLSPQRQKNPHRPHHPR